MRVEKRAESLAGSMQPRFDDRDARAEHSRRLFRGYSFDVAKQQNDSVRFRKLLDAALDQLARFPVLRRRIRKSFPEDWRIELMFALPEMREQVFNRFFWVALPAAQSG
jgi:hypothetical protein